MTRTIDTERLRHDYPIARIIADRLNLLSDDVEVFAGDAAEAPYGPSAISSRSPVSLMRAGDVAARLRRAESRFFDRPALLGEAHAQKF